MMTNNEIIEKVYRTFNIEKLIKDLISISSVDGSWKDLEQYIYYDLLNKDNEYLNKLYNKSRYYNITNPKNELRKFITGIIKNQRNKSGTYFNNKCKVKNIGIEKDYIYEIDIINWEKELKIDFILNELNRYEYASSGLTSEEHYYSICYELYKMKLKRKYSLKELSEHFKCSKRKIGYMISDAKQKIRNEYELYINTDSYRTLFNTLGDFDTE